MQRYKGTCGAMRSRAKLFPEVSSQREASRELSRRLLVQRLRRNGASEATVIAFTRETIVEGLARNLDRHLARQACIASPVDLAHASSADLFDDFVMFQQLAWAERHGHNILHRPSLGGTPP